MKEASLLAVALLIVFVDILIVAIFNKRAAARAFVDRPKLLYGAIGYGAVLGALVAIFVLVETSESWQRGTALGIVRIFVTGVFGVAITLGATVASFRDIAKFTKAWPLLWRGIAWGYAVATICHGFTLGLEALMKDLVNREDFGSALRHLWRILSGDHGWVSSGLLLAF